ncbi:MAG TPA: hypothetical protein VFS20_02825 [Longimicrobium sp.]|nr:hypothetical protein [Longimicrobium sp.]
MTRPLLLLAIIAAPVLSLPQHAAAQTSPATGGATLQPFGSIAELVEFHRRLQREEEQWRVQQPPRPHVIEETPYQYYLSLIPPPDPAGTPQQRERPYPDNDPEIAVRQTGGDERAVAKVHGEHLVVLQRGRLFTFRMGPGTLRPVSAVDAFGPHVDHLASWHDEVLVSGDRVLVAGTNQRLWGTELGVFHLAADGRLTHQATYSLATENTLAPHTYAAWMAGGRLIFYAPLSMRWTNPPAETPVLYRWGADSSRVQAAVPPTRLYRPAERVSWSDRYRMRLHTVLSCDLAGDDLRCDASAVYALPGSVFHASPAAVYVWTSREGGGSVLYCLPLDGSAPTALRVSGRPVDPFAFLESADGYLNVLVYADASSPEAWGAAYGTGLALLRIPLSTLGDGSGAAAPAQYHALPQPGASIRARYLGDWLVYGAAAGQEAYAVRWSTGRDPSRIDLSHGVERIEPMGSGAVLIGSDGTDLHLSTLRAGPGAPAIAHRHTVPGETRSHGFFYRPDGNDAGVLGLPIRSTERPRIEGLAAYPFMADTPKGPPLFLGPTRIQFLRNRGLRLEELGELAATTPTSGDVCLESCRHWYGNASPLFAGGRTFAVLGYELVEGREAGARLREVRRVGFAPAPPTAAISGDWAFSEYVGTYQGRYFCSNRGTMRFDRTGSALAMRYRQTGECTIDGVKTKSDGEGSGAGTVGPASLDLRVGDCQSSGHMRSMHLIDGTIRCRVRMPDGSTMDVNGRWSAKREPG